MHILLFHGNGGSRTRFLPTLDLLLRAHPDWHIIIPRLSGFDGRPLPQVANHWDLFLGEIEEIVSQYPTDTPWVLYGHGIGGSQIMEWAGRGYELPGGGRVSPARVILNSVIGASLDRRFFPQLMRPMWVRKLMQRLIAAPWMQRTWEKRLFQRPEEIDPYLKRRFFQDYAQCAAFPVFFDMITVEWYRELLPRIADQPFYFLWGENERIVQAKYLTLWRRDFPEATIDSVAGWDHFPMLDDPEDFTRKFLKLVRE